MGSLRDSHNTFQATKTRSDAAQFNVTVGKIRDSHNPVGPHGSPTVVDFPVGKSMGTKGSGVLPTP